MVKNKTDSRPHQARRPAGGNQARVGQSDPCFDGGLQSSHVREDVSVLVIMEMSLAESGVHQVTAKEGWEWCFRKREQHTQRPEGEGAMTLWH